MGGTKVCVGLTKALTDGGTGTWSSSNSLVAAVGSGTGVVTGIMPGTATIFYAFATGCEASETFTVSPNPAPIMGPSNVCPAGSGTASTITLTDATMGGGWSSSSSAAIVAGGVVTGNTTGTAIITYGLFSGCYNTTTITVYPTPAAITGITTFCQNTSVVLTDADAGGTWSSSNAAEATVGSGTGNVTGLLSGTPDISYTEPDGCSSIVALGILAAPVPTVIASGPTTFCSGGSVTLTTTGVGATYQWYSGTMAISGATTAIFTTTTTASYTVEITNSSNCSSTSVAIDVNAGLDPVITSSNPSSSFCTGNSTVLTANTGGISGSLTYQWANNGTIIPSATGATYDANVSGVYTASVTVSGGSGSCIAATPPYTVTVFPLPSPMDTFNGTAFVTGRAYHAYQWYLNTVQIPGATNYSWRPVANGSYDVVVTDVNGCTWHSDAIEYTGFVNAVAVPGSGNGIVIFPNPVTNTVHIQSPVIVGAVITGIEGKVWLSQADAKDINVSSLANGLYIIMLYDQGGNRVMVQKMIKE